MWFDMPKRSRFLSVALVLTVGLGATLLQAQVPSDAGAADGPEDVVAEIYELVSFGAGDTPDWDEVRSLFIPEAVIVLRTLVVTGVVLVMAGYLYGSHPFLTSERKYTALRGEVDNFIELVRRLNRTAIAIGGGAEFDEVTTEMRESLARIEELAGREA